MTDTLTIPGYVTHSFETQPQSTAIALKVQCSNAGTISDGYHTFDELYEHRCLLFCAFLRLHGGWKSKKHDDDSEWEDWFVAGAELNGKPITYHLPNRLWGLCPVPAIDKVPHFDGYTSKDVLDRIKYWLSVEQI